jgi:hypothetical protein
MVFTHAIVEVPLEVNRALTSILAPGIEPEPLEPDAVSRRLFTIRAADSMGHRSGASILVNRMYATRGYHAKSLLNEPDSHRITLIAGEADAVIGTITIGFDSGAGLVSDELFQHEIDRFRTSGQQVCEFTTLAVDSVVKSKRVLASLFHVAYIIAHRINGIQNLVIEVNPRHVRFYEAMLGFEVAGPERMNERVQAPAVLMRLALAHAREQIARCGGRPELAQAERSLYPYFFSPADEAGIVNRLH